MITRLMLILMIMLHGASNTPLRVRRSPRELPQSVLVHSVPIVHNYYQKQILSPVSQLYIPQKVHPNFHIAYKDRLPIITQNHTHNLLPILIPIYNIVTTGHRLIPIHDLSVIPLRSNVEKTQYRAVDKNEESPNQYRNFYGGYGTGLFFGGHGAGHGFYAYGK